MLQPLRDPAIRSWRSVAPLLLILILYAIALALLTTHHVPGSDEADGWLAARDLSLPRLFHFTRYVGNPALWYLILMPAAKLGAPYASMVWIHFAIALLAVAAFLFLAPFPPLTRILFIFSYYVGYEYAAISRNYALLALLLFFTASLYRRRWERPVTFGICIFLLFSTTTHGAFFGSILTAALLIEAVARRRLEGSSVILLAIAVAGAAFAAFQLWPPPDGQIQSFLVPMYPQFVRQTLARALVVPFGSDLTEPIWLLFNLAVFVAVIGYLLRRPLELAMALAGLASLFYIFVFKWCIPARHAGLLSLWLLFILWIALDQPASTVLMQRSRWLTAFSAWLNRDRVIRLLNVALFASCLQSIAAWDQAMRIDFSHAHQMANQIVTHGWDRKPIAATYVAESVLPYLPCQQFWNVQTREFLSHNTWNQRFARNAGISDAEIWRRIHEAAGSMPDLEVLWNWPLPYPQRNGYQLAMKTQGPVLDPDERFYFYLPLKAVTRSEAPATAPSTPSRHRAQTPSAPIAPRVETPPHPMRPPMPPSRLPSSVSVARSAVHRPAGSE